jgi:hypothetical protein
LNPEQRRLLKVQSVAGKRKASDGAVMQGEGEERGGKGLKRRTMGGGGGRGGGGKSVKDHAVSFLNTVLQEGVGGKQ